MPFSNNASLAKAADDPYMLYHQELECMSTIVGTIDATMKRYAASSAAVMASGVEQEIYELFELIPAILKSKESEAQRKVSLSFSSSSSPYVGSDCLQVLLLGINPTPFAVLQAVMASNATPAKLRIAALQTLTQLVTAVAENNNGQLMKQVVEGMAASKVVAATYSTLVDNRRRTQAENVAAAEALFVMLMRLPGVVQTVVNHGLTRMFDTLWSDNTSPGLRSYCLAVFRLLADSAPQIFVDHCPTFFPLCFRLMQHDPTRNSVVLMSEVIALVFERYPQHYISRVAPNNSMLDEMTRTFMHFLTMDSSNRDEDTTSMVQAVCNVISVVLKIEAAATGSKQPVNAAHPQPFCQKLMNFSLWKHCLLHRHLLGVVRQLVISSSCRDILAHQMLDCFEQGFPNLCLVLSDVSGQASHDDDNPQSSVGVIDAAIIIGVCCAKSPWCRDVVCGACNDHHAWAKKLFNKLRVIYKSILSSLDFEISDVNHEVLNDVVRNHNAHEERDIITCLCAQPSRRAQPQPPQLFPAELCDDKTLTRRTKVTCALLLAATKIALCQSTKSGSPMPTSEAGTTAKDPSQHFIDPMTLRPISPPRDRKASVTPVWAQHHTPRNHPGSASASARKQAPQQQAATVGDPTTERRQRALTGRAIGAQMGSPRLLVTPRRAAFKPSSPLSRTFDFIATEQDLMHSKKASAKKERVEREYLLATSPKDVLGGPPTPRVHHDDTSSTASKSDFAKMPRHGAGFAEEDYVSMSILMHLPLKYTNHYNRGQLLPATRVVTTTNGPKEFQMKNSTAMAHTWTIQDVQKDELFGLYIPFKKVSMERGESELRRLDSHLKRMSMLLVTTPSQKRTRRWFLHDMKNYVLPKIREVLVDFVDLVKEYGAETVMFQLGVIKLTDEGSRERGDVTPMLIGEEDEDTALHMTAGNHEAVTGLNNSSLAEQQQHHGLLGGEDIYHFPIEGKYEDMLHGGNILYAVRRLSKALADAKTAEEHKAAAANDEVTRSQFTHLADVEQQIRMLEERAAQDTWENADQAQMEDDVESVYDDPELDRALGDAAMADLEYLRQAGSESEKKLLALETRRGQKTPDPEELFNEYISPERTRGDESSSDKKKQQQEKDPREVQDELIDSYLTKETAEAAPVPSLPPHLWREVEEHNVGALTNAARSAPTLQQATAGAEKEDDSEQQNKQTASKDLGKDLLAEFESLYEQV